MNIDGYILINISGSNPEVYDVILNDVQVGYLRLIDGLFYAACPNVDGEHVFEATPMGKDMFKTYERMIYLTKAIEQIKLWVETTP